MDLNAVSRKNAVGSVMVVGGGIAGIQASLDLAESGFLVHLVEKKPQIGGIMAQLDKTFPTNDCSMCVISPKLVEVGRHLNIDLHTMSEIEGIKGDAGNFTVRLRKEARYVDLDKCTACGECTTVCPVEKPNMFDEGLSTRKAVFKLYPQGMPGAYAIDKKSMAPCKASCPAHVSVQGFIALFKQQRYKEAIALFREEHPFPGICGRVCHHPCENNCTRKDLDESVAVRDLHRFLYDNEIDPEVPVTEKRREEKVAVIGSGPAGLSCAYFLALEGYDVTVFEKLDVKGGMMAVGIPDYRLPKDILDGEIALIEALGVKIETGVSFGEDIDLNSLKNDGFSALYIAMGLHGGRKTGVKNEDSPGVIQGVDFLRDVSLGNEVKTGKNVVVIGGGNVAVDVAQTALRKGAENVTVVCLEAQDEMPAHDYEIEEAKGSGIRFVNSYGPQEFLIDDSGTFTGIRFKKCTSVFDDNGRFAPFYDELDNLDIESDNAFLAIGQSCNFPFLEDTKVELAHHGGIKADPLTLQTGLDWVFAGGDCVYGPKSVVEAVENGKEAALSVHRFINDMDLSEGREREFTFDRPDISDCALMERVPTKKNDLKVCAASFQEIAIGLSEEDALKESERCLGCGVCSECYQCEKVCLAGAIDHNMKSEQVDIDVGAVIIATGFKPFDPSPYPFYNYTDHPNVVTSLEFERILSASGPYMGHLVRPSDEKEPQKIAWLQCAGSRDLNNSKNGYCSSVCCMYAVKQTVIAKEHSDKDLEAVVFYMDMRTFGKDFDKYYNRAANEAGVRFVRSRVHTVEETDNDMLRLRYGTDDGKLLEETFDMVVISSGLISDIESINLSKKLGVNLNKYNFVETNDITPVETSREGIYVCGVFQGPKDIPLSVMEASAAVSGASERLSEVRGSLLRKEDLPEEIDVSGQTPRIGVFVCNCGINIGGIANVPEIKEFARSLPNVVHTEENLFTCSQDTQDKIKEVIIEKNINRVVVASCSPRTHEPLFQETIRAAGLNKYLFEMANIRDQNTWVHMNDKEAATIKAKNLVKMAVAKAGLVIPLYHTSIPVKPSLLVVGGGIAGMVSALSAAKQGFDVFLVERSGKLGGVALNLRNTVQGEDIRLYTEEMIEKIEENERIRLFLKSEVVETVGIAGDFRSQIISANEGVYTQEVVHGATVLATGGGEYKPDEYLYNQHKNVLTTLDFYKALEERGNEILDADTFVFIQCTGSRNDERPYCSKVCCTASIKNALHIKEENPDAEVFILYRDIRTYSFREELYTKAREKGVIFIRFEEDNPPEVLESDGELQVKTFDPILGRFVMIRPDYVVLASAVIPNENKDLFELFRVPINSEGFLVEAHAKLRPVDFSSDGIFLAGLAHYPKPVEETIAQAKAAVARAVTVLSKENITAGGVVAEVAEPDRCACCLICVRSCPYHVPYVADGHANIDPSECHGCGVCASECPAKVIRFNHFTDVQIMAKTDAVFKEYTENVVSV